VGIGAIAIVYTTMGGMRAVIWTDVAQFAILFGGLAFTIGFIFFETGTGPATWFNDVMQADREPQPFFAFDPYVRVSLLGMAIYAMFWWTCTAGSDQVAIQRYLTTGSVQGARRSFISNLGADMTIALSLGLTGMALYSYYLGQLPGTPDQAFPHFIAHGLPRGLAGLVVAALFSAAMSSLDSGMHGVATVLTVDFFRRLRKQALDAAAELKLARTITILAGLFAVGFCLYLNTIPEETRGNLFDLTVRISSYITGALGGMFFAAFLRFRCSGRMLILSGFLGMAVGFYLSLATWLQTHPDIFIYADVPGQTETVRWEPSSDRENTIGSDSGANEFVLTGEGVADRHAVVRRTESGWQLESIGETRINDEPVTQAQIRPDDSIQIAGNRLLVKVKAVSWMWVLPSSCLVTLFSAGLLGLFRRRRASGTAA
jgi:Na+/proline symporter